jgi:dipeptidyl aminopeptidase/acylaminoacyl peptidase
MTRLAVVLAALVLMAAGPERGVRKFEVVAISPDGAHVVSVEGDVPVAGGNPPFEPLVIRDVPDGREHPVVLPCGQNPECTALWPAWSPDGKHLAFTLRTPGGHDHSIYTVDADGGTPRRLLDFDGTLVFLRYLPDGRLTVLATANATKEAGATAEGAQLVGDLSQDLRDRRLAVIDQKGLHWASPPDLNVYEYDALPGGRGFVGTAAPPPGDAHWWQAKLYRFDPDGKAQLLFAPSDPAMQIALPAVSPDGSAVSFVGGLMSDFFAVGGDAYVLKLDQPGAAPVDLTPSLPATVTSLSWACQPGRLSAVMLAQDRTEVAELDAARAALPTILWSGNEVLTGDNNQISANCRTPVTATIHENFTTGQEIETGPVGAWHDLTHVNAGITTPARAVNVTWTNDGLPGQGWLLLPAGANPAERLPMITVVHGGPAWASEPTFVGPGFNRDLLAHGYALFLPNPRGSYGQGEAFTRANMRDLGHGDLRDILAGVDAAIAAGPIDPTRLGITGVSYGGFMTMWAGTQTRRFRAGVAVAGISDWLSYSGTAGTVGWLQPYFGASIYDDPEIYARSSPIGHIRDATMPTLAMVGAEDIECPPGQTVELWHALQAMGVATDAVVYAGEGHGLVVPADVADSDARAIAWFNAHMSSDR